MATNGLDACARALSACVDVVANAGGEGSRRLAEPLRGRGVRALAGDGADAVRGALGHNLAGGRAAVLVSGSSVFQALSVLNEARRMGVGLPLIVVSHGAESGRPAPDDDLTDLGWLLDAVAGLIVAGAPGEVAAVTTLVCERAWESAGVWCACFELAGVGLASVVPPESRDVTAPLVIDGDPRGRVARVYLGAGAGAASGERGVRVRRLRPWPKEDISQALAGAHTVRVEEPFGDALGGAGRLTEAVRRVLWDARGGEQDCRLETETRR